MISFNVVGTPVAQGSKRIIPTPNGPRLIETASNHRTWRTDLHTTAKQHAETLDKPLDGPLTLTITFRFPMPQSRPKRVRAAGKAPKTTTPDLDKLIRAVGDALTEAGLIRDDARITNITATKIEVADSWTGAQICIEPLQTGPT